MTYKRKKYKWFIYGKNYNVAWGFHWEYPHKDWKEKEGNNNSVRFSDSATDTVIYFSYLMSTSEESAEEEKGERMTINKNILFPWLVLN